MVSHSHNPIDSYDVVIIGAGPAGIFAAYLAHIKGLTPLLVEATTNLGGQPQNLYSQKKIYDYPGFYGIKAYELINHFRKQLHEHSPIKTLLQTTVASCRAHASGWMIGLSNQHEVFAKAIIIATGAGIFNPNKLTINVDQSNHIHYAFDSLDHFRNKRVVILGGGDAAVDWANELAENQISNDVTIIHRRNEFRANGENVARMQVNKIKVLLDYEIISIANDKVDIKHNITHEVLHIPYQVVLVQYGQSINRNNLEPFKNVAVNSVGRIVVKINQMTSIENIYAIGDVCIYEGKPSSLICAHGEAAVAVRDIVNRIKQYDKK